jgi:hypothetical protein
VLEGVQQGREFLTLRQLVLKGGNGFLDRRNHACSNTDPRPTDVLADLLEGMAEPGWKRVL